MAILCKHILLSLRCVVVSFHAADINHNKYPHAESAEYTDWHVALPVLPSGWQHERSE
ncbi:MAG: hypothetical protein J6C15_02480 [Bacteroidaceae bacterium]|nr:hypothetical protein [Bacteroidaceae bacterium]